MKASIFILTLWAIVIFSGGLIGYLKAGSLISIVMASLFAAAILFSAWGVFQGCPYGRWMGIAVTGLLTCFFFFRFLKSGHFMPSGLMTLLSLGVIAALSYTIFRK